MNILAASERNLKKLLGYEIVNIIDGCKQYPKSKIICFKNSYRKTMIDLFIMENGSIYISDVYGENMKRDRMDYIRI